MDVFGFSHKGKLREKNEDSYKIVGFKNGEDCGFCIVADGMGGHNSGEIASKIAVEVIEKELIYILKNKFKHIDLKKLCSDSFDKANEEIFNLSTNNKKQSGMGTTAVLCFVNKNTVFIANIGDSGVYVFNGSGIKKITTDHSIVAELVESGNITQQEAREHPQKHFITRALGTCKTIKTDFYEYLGKQGDIIIMATDGLSEMLDLKEILSIVLKSKCVKETVLSLIKEANKKGGFDNITVVAIKI